MTERVEIFVNANNYNVDKVTTLVNSMADVGYMLIYSGPATTAEGVLDGSKLIFQRISSHTA